MMKALRQSAQAFHEVKEQLDQGDVACVIVEPILSDGGMVVPPKGFFRWVTSIMRKGGCAADMR